jgi:sterol desaturase/sphingolipid hydroxylase (fatty acid hydroxylase superfamily)
LSRYALVEFIANRRMADWLLGHQAAIQSYTLLGSFAIVALWESFLPRRALSATPGARWYTNIALAALGSFLARWCLPVAGVAVAALAQERHWGLLNQAQLPIWSTAALGVLLIDLGGYAKHRAMHAVPLLWRLHRIHHADLDVDCATAIRHHPVETLLASTIDLGLIAAIGAPPIAVLVAAVLGGIAAVVNHGNVALPRAAEGLIRLLVVTPDMHRIHHSTAVDESNRNFANLFSWWDRLFATYARDPRQGHERIELGIAELRQAREVTLWKLLVLPLLPIEQPIPDSVGSGASVSPSWIGIGGDIPKEDV